jgi:hypothetical protein
MTGGGALTRPTTGTLLVVVVGWGLSTAACLTVGLATVGGLLALVQLGVLVGAPLALSLGRQLRAQAVTVVVSVALSVALSALAAQSVRWFGLGHPALVVVAATVYGAVLAILASDTDVTGVVGR